ncbi:restriction endonuclease [Agromyces marinus]|nr:restriction endonuclease [Agromyces marinus]
MRSVNSARDAGTRIGRSYPDVWVPDEILMQVVRSHIRPQIKLQRSAQDHAAEGWSTTFTAMLGLAFLTGSLLVLSLLPELVLSPFPESIQGVIRALNPWSPLLTLVSIALVLLSVGTGLVIRRARQAARDRHRASVRALIQSGFEGAKVALEKRRAKQGMPLDRDLALHVTRNSLRPDPARLGVTPRGAEELVAQWMRHLGETDAEVTSYRGDGGVDVGGRKYIAQVKHYAANVGVAPIREIAGVASADGRSPLFFTSTGYASGAIEFADRSGIALFLYSAELGELHGMNGRAKTLMIHGLN